MTMLSRNNPYGHFSSLASPCFNLLFHGAQLEPDEGGDSDDDLVWAEV